MAAFRKLKTIRNLLIFSSYTFKVVFSVFYQFFVSSTSTGQCDFRTNTCIDKGHATVLFFENDTCFRERGSYTEVIVILWQNLCRLH